MLEELYNEVPLGIVGRIPGPDLALSKEKVEGCGIFGVSKLLGGQLSGVRRMDDIYPVRSQLRSQPACGMCRIDNEVPREPFLFVKPFSLAIWDNQCDEHGEMISGDLRPRTVPKH